MKPTKPKSEEQEQPKDLDEFEQFIKAIWSVTPKEIDQQRQEKLASRNEEKKLSPDKENYSKNSGI